MSIDIIHRKANDMSLEEFEKYINQISKEVMPYTFSKQSGFYPKKVIILQLTNVRLPKPSTNRKTYRGI